MAKVKTKFLRVPKVSIEAVRNGYVLTVKPSKSVNSGFDIAYTYTVSGAGPVTTEVRPYGRYTFPNFASLTAWLRKNITHGNGVEA